MTNTAKIKSNYVRASRDDMLKTTFYKETLPLLPAHKQGQQSRGRPRGDWQGCLKGSSPTPPHKEHLGKGDLARHLGKICLLETPVYFDVHIPGFYEYCLVNYNCVS